MIIRNWFGVPAWVLASEYLVRTALEIFHGIPVGFVRFKAKTTDAHDNDSPGRIYPVWYRTVQIEAEFARREGFPNLDPIKATIKLRKVGDNGVWCYAESGWSFKSFPCEFKIRNEKLEEDSLNRLISVTRLGINKTVIGKVQGTSLIDREEIIIT